MALYKQSSWGSFRLPTSNRRCICFFELQMPTSIRFSELQMPTSIRFSELQMPTSIRSLNKLIGYHVVVVEVFPILYQEIQLLRFCEGFQ
jgi:hypothetical protein